MSTAELAEVLTFGLLMVIFHGWEKVRPAHPVDRRRELLFDLVALVWLAALVGIYRRVLRHTLVLFGAQPLFGHWPLALKLIIGFLAVDLCLYGIHRAMHRVGFLWPTHRFHHSVEQLWWLSGFRTSAVHGALFALPQTLIPYGLVGVTPGEAAVAYSIAAFFQIWTHADIDPRLGLLEKVIVTPAYHRVHHSVDVRLQNCNLGMIVVFWDRLFGTYIDPRKVDVSGPLGLMPKEQGVRRWIGV